MKLAEGTAGGFVVTAGGRRIEAANVIVATGSFTTPHVPEFATGLDPSIRQLHSSDYRNPGQLRDGPVLVVGVSHSGADIAYELAGSHRTVLSGRSHGELPIRVIDSWKARLIWPLIITAATHLLTLRTPIGRKIAPQVRAGGGPLLRIRSDDLARAGVERREERTVGVSDGKPMLAGGEVLDVRNVIWATGFREGYDWVQVPGFMGADGWPVGTRGVVDATPGLYVLGVPFTFGFTSMLVAGAGRDAKYVVARLADRSAARSGMGAAAIAP